MLRIATLTALTALTALRQPDATQADIPRLLTEPGFLAGRTTTSTHVDDPTLKGFWDAYERMSPAAQSRQPAATTPRCTSTRRRAS